MKKLHKVLLITGILVIAWLFIRFVIGGDEDSWIKDENGIWSRHGNPSETPDYVLEQQTAIECASGKFSILTEAPDSQCIGTCGNYSVDIVHVPRTAEDDKTENQCDDYRNGKTSYFIELDKDGNIARIA